MSSDTQAQASGSPMAKKAPTESSEPKNPCISSSKSPEPKSPASNCSIIMSETPSQMPSPEPGPRPVARRACLSCREKKIKCDGELMPVSQNSDGPTCSNCRMVGIPCVFVQSNRGGRRRKRSSVGSGGEFDDDRKPPPFGFSPRLQRPIMDPDTPSSMSDYSSMGPRSPSFGPPESGKRFKEGRHRHHHRHHRHHHGPHGPHGFFPYGPPKHHPPGGYHGHGHGYWPPPPPPPHHHGPPPPMGPYPPFAPPYCYYPPPPPPPPGPPPGPRDEEDRRSYGFYPPFPPGPPPPPGPPGHFPFPPPPHFYGSHYEDSKCSNEEERRCGPFKPSDLKAHMLPPWETLSGIVSYYYKVCHPSDQLLPSENTFIESIFLRNDAALLHAIIARVCSAKKWNIDGNEESWVRRTYKYMDTLDDHGMLVCYTLLRKTPSVRSDPGQLSDVNAKFMEIVDSNRYMELLSSSVNMNRRKRMDREMKVRAIWSFWIDLVAGSESYLSVFEDAEKAEFPLPVSNENYAKGEIVPVSWDELKKGKLYDSTALIRAAMDLNESKKSPESDSSKSEGASPPPNDSSDKDLESFLKVYYTLEEDRIVLNPHMAMAQCLYSSAQFKSNPDMPVDKRDMKDTHWKSLAKVSRHVGKICEVIEVSRGYGSHPVVFGASSDGTGAITQGRDGWRRVGEIVVSAAESASKALEKVLFSVESTTRVEPELDPQLLRKCSHTLQRFLRFCEPMTPTASPQPPVKNEDYF